MERKTHLDTVFHVNFGAPRNVVRVVQRSVVGRGESAECKLADGVSDRGRDVYGEVVVHDGISIGRAGGMEDVSAQCRKIVGAFTPTCSTLYMCIADDALA